MTETLSEKCKRVAQNFVLVGKRATAHILFGNNYTPENPDTSATMLRYCILLDRAFQFSRVPEKKYLLETASAFRDVVAEVSNVQSNKILDQIMLCDTVDLPRMAILDSLLVLWHGEHTVTFKNHTKSMSAKIESMVYVVPNGYRHKELEQQKKDAAAKKDVDTNSKKDEEEKRKREECNNPWPDSESDSDYGPSIGNENGCVKKRRRLRKLVVNEDKPEEVLPPQPTATPAPVEGNDSPVFHAEAPEPEPVQEEINPELRPFSERTRWPYEEMGTSSKFETIVSVQHEPEPASLEPVPVPAQLEPVATEQAPAKPAPVKQESKKASPETSSKSNRTPRWCEGHSNRISAVAGEYAVQEMVWHLMKSLPHGFRVEQKNGKFKLVVTKTYKIPITIEPTQATKRPGYYAYVDREKIVN